jgi:hypothetical protein
MNKPGRPKTIMLVLLTVAGSVAAVLLVARPECPPQGLALSPGVREAVRLKNRTALPRREDFDGGVSLAALLRPGDDRSRWSEARAAALEGFVVEVKKGGIEAANCYSPVTRDTHIHVALRPEAPPRERVVVEVTPRLEGWARRQGRDWSEPALRRDLQGRRCRFEGWLYFDREHAAESENTAPGGAGNWRATAWEVHPVTAVSKLEGDGHR